jgi:hypothetical protein
MQLLRSLHQLSASANRKHIALVPRHTVHPLCASVWQAIASVGPHSTDHAVRLQRHNCRLRKLPCGPLSCDLPRYGVLGRSRKLVCHLQIFSTARMEGKCK